MKAPLAAYLAEAQGTSIRAFAEAECIVRLLASDEPPPYDNLRRVARKWVEDHAVARPHALETS